MALCVYQLAKLDWREVFWGECALGYNGFDFFDKMAVDG
jgi:hypothetical protein